jgi:ribulose-bisphosphate carboxylase large chain
LNIGRVKAENGPMERVGAHYLIETPGDAAAAAEALAGEQSSGTFVAVPGETLELKERFAARVERITRLESSPQPALAGTAPAASYQRATIEVSWPVENFGCNLPALLSTIQGNLYELSQLSGAKLLDVDLPESYVANFAGPRFGVEGTRRLAGVRDRPLVGTIIKPSVGLAPGQTAELVETLADADIDFIKDDELMADPPYSPFAERLGRVMAVIRRHEDRTGKKILYAFNLSGDIDAMLRNYERVAAAGGSCVMLSLNTVGMSGVKRICDCGALAVHGHRNGWGMLTRHPILGIEFTAYQKIWRLAGVDQIHVNGLANKFWEPDDSVVRSIRACLEPLGKLPAILPVVSSGQWGGQAPETFRRTRTTDLLYLAGGGILAHPGGPAQGVRALRLWWEAAVDGLDAAEAAKRFPLLAQSAAKFGKPS